MDLKSESGLEYQVMCTYLLVRTGTNPKIKPTEEKKKGWKRRKRKIINPRMSCDGGKRSVRGVGLTRKRGVQRTRLRVDSVESPDFRGMAGLNPGSWEF